MKLFAENNLKKWIIFLPIIGIISTSIILTLLFVSQNKKTHEKELKQIEELYVHSAKKLTKDRINNVIQTLKQQELFFGKNRKEEFKKFAQKFLNEFRFENNNYIFAYDYKANTIAHIKQSLIGTNRWDLKKGNEYTLRNILLKAQKNDGTHMQYLATLNPNTNLPSQKISYVKKIDSLKWVLGTGIYIDDLNELVQHKEQMMEKELEKTIITNIQLAFFLTLIGVFVMFLPANNIFNIVKRYKKILALKNETLEEKVKERTKEQDTLLSLFNEADTVLFKWDFKSNKLLYVSKSISRILGFTEIEFLSEKIKYKNCIHSDDFLEYKKQYQEAISADKPFYEHLPYRIITKDNQIKWIHDYTLLVRNDEGEITSLIGYITDITLLKEHDKIISNQTKMASLGEMIGNISHQWRQPLSAISSAASGMKLHKDLGMLTDKSFFESINGIMRNSNYLSETINDFTNYIKEDKTEQVFDLKEILTQNLLLLDGNIKINHIDVIENLHDDINIYGNKHELIQVCMNIINNAIDGLKNTSTPNKLLFLSTQKLKNGILIQFKDNAGGIDETIIDKIFEPYFTTKHKARGTGLGLYMAHNIIKNMKGKLFATNVNYIYSDVKYKGALFTIELPLK